jgi:K(+)-stimulated pyrophosphate-energized sodium pump
MSISTTRAQKELAPLALLGILTPIVVGLMLQVQVLGGFLAGIIVSGQLLAVFLDNSGGAWDNAKKLIEDEPRDLAKTTGKGSERHKAGVVGDTVGDPFKDTAGPALNPMIKVVNLVSVIIAPIVVQFSGDNVTAGIKLVVWIVALALLGVLAWTVMRSKTPAESMTVDVVPAK